MSKNRFIHSPLTRREMLCVCKTGFGSLAMMSLFGSCVNKSNGKDLLARLGQAPQYIPKVKNIIFLYMDGGVSQVDSFDPKPRLAKENGEDPSKKFKGTSMFCPKLARISRAFSGVLSNGTSWNLTPGHSSCSFGHRSTKT